MRRRLKIWAALHLIEDKRPFHKLWSIRIALLWGAASGAYAALPAFQDYLGPVGFGLISMGLGAALVFARITKQPIE